MQPEFITLACTGCGASLDVYDDMELFSCRYCGTKMMVQRRGATIALKSVEKAIERVQAGTDKTAAELAITRITKDLERLNKERTKVLSGNFSLQTMGCGCGGLAGLFGLILLTAGTQDSATFGILSLLVCGIAVTMTFTGQKAVKGKVAVLEAQISELNTVLAEKKVLAES